MVSVLARSFAVAVAVADRMEYCPFYPHHSLTLVVAARCERDVLVKNRQ